MECEEPLEVFGGYKREKNLLPSPSFDPPQKPIEAIQKHPRRRDPNKHSFPHSQSAESSRNQNGDVVQSQPQEGDYHHRNNANYHQQRNSFSGRGFRFAAPYQRNVDSRPPQFPQHFNGNQYRPNQGNFRGQRHFGRGGFSRPPYDHAQNGSHGRYNNQNSRFRQGGNNHNGNQYQPEHSQQSPWMTSELLAMIQEKNKVQSDAMVSQNPDTFRMLKALRGRLNIAINDAKHLYNEKLKEANILKAQGKKAALYCDPCDRAFPDENTFKEHKDEHMTCKLDGCTFTAHPKIILKHIQMQHSNNLYFRVKGHDSPEEIKKWIDERKSKFPTSENVEKKKAERIERQQRGEIMGTGTDNRNRRNKFRLDPKNESRNNSFNRPDYKHKKKRNFKRSVENGESVISSTNVSAVISLENFYSSVVVSENGDLIGKTKVRWMNGKFKEDLSSDSECSDENLEITDDEDENIFSNVNLNRSVSERCDSGVTAIFSPPFDTALQEICSSVVGVESSTGKNPGLLGLVSYGSDSDTNEENNTDEKALPKPDLLFAPVSNTSPKITHQTTHLLNDAPAASSKLSKKSAGKSKSCNLATKPPMRNNIQTMVQKYKQKRKINVVGSAVKILKKTKTLDYKRKEKPISSDDNVDQQMDQMGDPGVFVKEKKFVIIEVEESSNKPPISNTENNEKNSHFKSQSCSGFPGKRGPRNSQYARNPNMPSRRRITFLERLLKDEINKERNYILQACRYIVENNFFDDPPTSNGSTLNGCHDEV